MELLFDSRNRYCKEPFGCIRQGSLLSIHFCIRDGAETGMDFFLQPDGEEGTKWPMTMTVEEDDYHHYRCSVVMDRKGLFFYHFILKREQSQNQIFRNNLNVPILDEGESWQITCYEEDANPPSSYYGKVIYQILPDRFFRLEFCDSSEKLTPFILHENTEDMPNFMPDQDGRILNHDFFGGNLRGIMQRIPYLKALHVEVIYLNPIFMAYSNHRYDTADYLRIDPLLGTEADFKALCDACHEAGIRVLLDGVFSHTGSNSLYFDIQNRFGGGAFHNPDSPYRSWYQFEENSNRYQSWWGIDTLPCVNEMNEDYRRFINTGEDSVIRHWMRLGADGWRLDVADELPDPFLAELYKTVKQEKPDSLVIGEVWEDASNKISYGVRRKYMQGGHLDSVMNYVWRDAILRFVMGEASGRALHEAIMTLCEHYPPQALHSMMNLLSTHDTPRILTLLADEPYPETRQGRAEARLSELGLKRGMERLLAAEFLLFTLPGSSCIYYGDEIGMEGYEDPFNRRYLGDSIGRKEILSAVKALSEMKTTHPAFKDGQLTAFLIGEHSYGFLRHTPGERIVCILNCDKKALSLPLFSEKILYKNQAILHKGELFLRPMGAIAFLL